MAPEEWSVDELAQLAGTTARNVRLYQERGVLAPPRREGRRGWYNAEHLRQLRLVLSMLRRGYSLGSIRELVDAREARRSLDDVLGFEEVLAEPYTTEEPRWLALDEVAGLFPGARPEELDRAIRLGLITPDGDGFVAPSPILLEAGAALVADGIPLDAVLDGAEEIFESTDRLAARFVGIFVDHLWEPFAERGMPADEVPGLTAVLSRMRPLAARGVIAGLAQAMQRHADEAAAAAGVIDWPASPPAEPQ
jgi:DNA-binding transcriptional MerR regulator